jgi:hypothetical protein
MSTATPLRDVITIPESVSANDYVLKLTDGVSHARQTRSCHQGPPSS